VVPGTGLSWSMEHTPDRPAVIPAGRAAGLPNSRRLRPEQLDAFKQLLLELLQQEQFTPVSTGAQLWENGSVSLLLTDGSMGSRTMGLLALIETPEAMEEYLLRAQSQDDAKLRAQRRSAEAGMSLNPDMMPPPVRDFAEAVLGEATRAR